MPSEPIPIAPSSSNSHNLAPSGAAQGLTSTPSSSVSTSPQTPFYQTGPTPFRWPFSSLKSPVFSSTNMFPFDSKSTNPNPNAAATNPNTSSNPSAPTEPRILTSDSAIAMDDDEGEIADLGKGWASNRLKRAVSLSVSPAGGILAGFAPDGAQPGSLVGDKVARGQGVLRRLSLSGNGFAKSAFLSPSPPNSTQVTNQPLPSSTSAAPRDPISQIPNSLPIVPADDSELRPPPSIPRGGRRRFSESAGQRKRGVSPMGERILRDHGHF